MNSKWGDLNLPQHHQQLLREFQRKFLEEGVYLNEQQVFGRIVLCALRDAHHLTDDQRMEMFSGWIGETKTSHNSQWASPSTKRE